MTSETENLNRKTFLASLWTVGLRMSVRMIGIISMIILARLLNPDDYGLVAKAVMIQGFLFMITEFGLEAALITNQKATKDHYNTAWTIHIIRGITIALLLAVLAIPASSYFNDARLELIIYCYAGITFLDGFYNIGVVDFRKNMTFQYDFYYNLYKKLAAFAVTITIAIIWQTYWALVAGVAAHMMASLIASFLMSSFRPKFSLIEWRSLFNFSKWIFINEIVKAFAVKIDMFLLSHYGTNAQVGLYTVSKEISSIPSTEIAMPVGRACAPGFAKLNDNIGDFSNLYLSTLSIILTIVLPTSVGVSLLAEPIIKIALGVKWLEAIPVLEILALYGLFRATKPILISALLSYNRPDILTLSVTISAINNVVLMLIGVIFFGFYGLLYAALLSAMLMVIIDLFITSYLKLLSIIDLLQNIWRAIIATVIMAGSLMYLRQFAFLEDILIAKLIIQILAGAIIYSLTICSLWYIASKPNGPEEAILKTLLGKFIRKEKQGYS